MLEISANAKTIPPPASAEERRRCLEMHVGAPFTYGNAVQALHNGLGIFPPMLRAIREARQSVHLLSYIYRKGAIAEAFCEALCERAQAGVTVRVLLDALGAAEIRRENVERMREAGVELQWFRKPYKTPRKPDKRTHRKVLVCDNRIGYTGGMGIGRRWEGNARDPNEWREMHFEFRGPSVYALNASFWENWIEARPEARPDMQGGAASDQLGEAAVQVVSLHSGRSDRTGQALVNTLVWLARQRLDIVTAYLAPDRHVLGLLKERARLGVSVRLLVPGRNIDAWPARWEAERYFSELLEAGVRIYRYERTMMHSKALLVDDDLALVGSLNLDRRSFRKDEEVAAVVQDEVFVAELTQALEDDLNISREIRAEEWKQRPWWRRIRASLLRPIRNEI